MHRIARLITLSLSALAFDAWAAADAGTEFADTLEQRLIGCSFCHGKQGEGHRQNEYYPRIAGKPPEYLYRQLVNFRDGRRTYPQMVYMSRHLSDEYLREIATYYSKLSAAVSDADPAVGDEGGACARASRSCATATRRRAFPACVACHGKALTGMLPGDPGPRRAVSRLHQRTDSAPGAAAAQGDRAGLHGEHRGAVDAAPTARRRPRTSRASPERRIRCLRRTPNRSCR